MASDPFAYLSRAGVAKNVTKAQEAAQKPRPKQKRWTADAKRGK